MLKVKKSFALCIMMIFLVTNLLFTACSAKPTEQSQEIQKSEEQNQANSQNGEKVEVDVFQFKVEIAKELEEAARAYEAEHPNVKINIQTVGGGDDYGAALRAKFQSGQEPDIFNVGGPQDVKDWMSKLEDLSDQPWVKLALPGILSGATVDGKIYALPFNIEGYGLVYNKAIFKDAGIDASKITSFESLEEAVKKLDKKIKSGELKDKYPLLEAVFEYPAKETWVTGLHTSNAVLSQEFDSSMAAFNSKKVDFKYGDALKALIDLQADYSSNADKKAKLNAVDYATQVDEGIAIGRVAIIQQGNWIYGGVKNIDENVANNLDILPLPVKGAVEDSIPVGVPMHWAINKNSPDADKEAAKDFLNWLYTSEKGKDFIVNKFFFIPPLKGFENLELKDPLGKAVKRYAEEGKTMPWVFMGYPTGWGQEVLGTNIQKYLAGEMTWDKVISNSKSKWEEMRQQ
ncbi:raffinose/stachyose/melibiose transport system substrate-binding protein [Caminicella sporogenes DSM 14501]|uniref:Raffinose/stachyose/melibiose transport system substrate-binding protein n=1 Tax=Caminicella sporogenes DSM 14501 TaxID=1121266 RepID=A0A1M6MK51_9FIRM|nr:extracellular solute-binding protein [Caminicella sporogenes]RKD27512.1 sugar ABC transporter substrate-binding protein [Caminicella sporogenes]SHJ83869.1 raffinose/stachyose/melibiose transport system substrate-binding protein [Caminicella sporogenes DSM 14501]